MKDLHGSGDNRVCYRMKRREQITLKKMAEKLAYGGSGLSEGDVLHVMTAFVDEMVQQLADGNSVTIDGWGTFHASIGTAKGKKAETWNGEETKRNAQSLIVKNIGFKASKELVRETNLHCHLQSLGVSRLHPSPYTEAQRLQLVHDYLKQHHLMRVKDYQELSGLSRTKASEELRRWREDPATGITTSGKGSGIVYVLRALLPSDGEQH